MKSSNVVNDLRIATPCPAAWEAMRGDDRVRFCESCSRHVYDLSVLTAAEITALIGEAEGRTCVRLYRRADGTVLTADCPVGLRQAVRRRLVRMLTAGVMVLASMRAGLWLSEEGQGRAGVLSAPSGRGVSLSDWADWAARALGIRKPGGVGVVAGEICTIPAPIAPNAGAGSPGPAPSPSAGSR